MTAQTRNLDPAALIEFGRARLNHDLGEIDAIHLDDCQRRSDGCDCMWPDQIRDAIAGKRLLLDEYEQHVRGPVPGDPTYAAGWRDALQAAVRVMACEWSGHPDFQPKWTIDIIRAGGSDVPR